MKKLLVIIFLFVMVFSMAFTLAAESADLVVKANVLEKEISISVPEEVIFQDIAPGYVSEKQSLDIENIGTVDVSISADLDDAYDGDVFTNLAFRRVLTDDLVNIRYFDFEIEKPTVVGGSRTENIYMYIDLTEYEGTTAEQDHTGTVIFTAVPA